MTNFLEKANMKVPDELKESKKIVEQASNLMIAEQDKQFMNTKPAEKVKDLKD